MQRGNGLKRTGFKKSSYERAPRQALQPISPEIAARVSMPRADGMGQAVAKTEPQRNARLLRLSKGASCNLMLPVCCHDWSTTVAAHSNQARHGKSKGRKADDCFVVDACFTCHQWLDQGTAPKAEKEAAFNRALERQLLRWRLIADSTAYSDADRAAARWALERLCT